MRDGWVTVDRGRIVAATARYPGAGAREVDLGDVAVMPGLVNAHTHLELSYLRDEVPPASQFVTWIRHVIAARRTHPDARSAEILTEIERAIDEAIASGTALVGDISNTLVTFAPLARSALAAVVFYELIQFAAPDPRGFVDARCRQLDVLVPTERVRCSLAAHAPYSVGPLVFRAIREAVVTCPRSNGPTGAGAPPIGEFYRAGVRVAVGTDSLASCPDLNVFAELATMRALAPHVPAARLLDSATREGARALGFDAEYGTIEPGKRARLLAVNVPPSVEDVEEYLVSETKPSQVTWLG